MITKNIDCNQVNNRKIILFTILILYSTMIIISLNVGLTADAAHYALYGKFTSWGYVDHPPMIGWLQAFFMYIFGKGNFSLHLVAYIISLAILFFTYRISTKLIDSQNKDLGYFCILALFLSCVYYVISYASLTQGPLILFCLCSTYFLWQAITKESSKYLIAMNISLGFAGLSDYTAFLCAVGLYLYIIIYAPKLLKFKSLYVGMIMSLIIISPFFIWNMKHHFISFTAGYNRSFHSGWSWESFWQSIAIQIIGYSPALTAFSLIGLYSAIRERDNKTKLLAFSGLPVILTFIYSGGHHRIFFHWPAVGWVILTPVAVNEMIKRWHKLSTKIILGLSIIMCLSIYSFILIETTVHHFDYPLSGSPLRGLYGWKAAADRGKLLDKQVNPQGKKIQLFVNNWSTASRIAWYSGVSVQIASPSKVAGYLQFKQWFDIPNKKSNGVMIVPIYRDQPIQHSKKEFHFSNCKLINKLSLRKNGNLLNEFLFYHCWHYNR